MSLYEWWSDEVGRGDTYYSVIQYRRIRKRPSLVLHTPGMQQAVASFASREEALAFCAVMGLEVREDKP